MVDGMRGEISDPAIPASNLRVNAAGQLFHHCREAAIYLDKHADCPFSSRCEQGTICFYDRPSLGQDPAEPLEYHVSSNSRS